MHELSIAQAIVDVAARHAGESSVARVYVQVGRLRQVVPSALAFAFELCAHGTAVEGAELELEEVPVVVTCRDCGAESRPARFPLTCGADTPLPGLPLCCASCGGLDVEVLQGEELLVDSLEIEEPLVTNGGTRYGR